MSILADEQARRYTTGSHAYAGVLARNHTLRHYRADWKARVLPSKPVQRYLMRLQDVAKQQPYLLIAHSFAMHSALMAGGQLTKRMLTKHVKLDPGKGTAIFDYQARQHPIAGHGTHCCAVCSNCQTQCTCHPFVCSCRSLYSP